MTKNITAKVSEKGCVSIYGIRRFPISLYPEELEAILVRRDPLLKFLKANEAAFKPKEARSAAPKEGHVSI